MNNPNSPRETWKEFEQEMQDFVLSVLDVAESQVAFYGFYAQKVLSADMQADLIQWVEYRYLDGTNALHPEDEFQAFLDWDEKRQNWYDHGLSPESYDED